MGNSQSQKAGEGALQIQAQGNVTIAYGVSYAELDMKIAEARREEVLSKAQEMLKGVEPEPVPLKSLVRLLQYASLEDDAFLQERWAALLANASNPTQDQSKRTIHISLLKELSAAEVRFLDAAYAYVVERISRDVRPGAADGLGWEVDMQFILNQSVDEGYFNMSYIDNLERLNLLRRSTTHEMNLSSEPVRVPGRIEQTSFYLTELAFFLVEACHPPQAEDAE